MRGERRPAILVPFLRNSFLRTLVALVKTDWSQVRPNVKQNLISGFKATGLYPCNPRLPDATDQREQLGRLLDTSLVELLGVAKDRSTKRKRRKKVEAGMIILPSTSVTADDPVDNPENPSNDESPSTPGLQKPDLVDFPDTLGLTSKKKERKQKLLKENTEEGAASSSKKRTSGRIKQTEGKCRICKMLWTNYRGHVDWIKCCKCHKWVWGPCNEDSKDPFCVCAVCDDDLADEDPFQTDEEEEFVP
ncbi:hypothetical protein NQ318_004543 [Aromia moschata]|uniref:Uncharacterized protein n=1 Tax=Aromia moschata TaxID=1265417 RepID=A0AAV8XNJ5_9CUCU|nr:hypothetical protein NQ318_004543 [Aromia moschata]